MRYFFYGTLLDREVRRLVLGPVADRIEPEPALLQGWRRVRLRGRQYPVIVRQGGGSVEGCVIAGLPASAVNRLVRFEGPEYSVTAVPVSTASGTSLQARTFIASGRTAPVFEPWDFEEWRRLHRADFLRRLRGGDA